MTKYKKYLLAAASLLSLAGCDAITPAHSLSCKTYDQNGICKEYDFRTAAPPPAVAAPAGGNLQLQIQAIDGSGLIRGYVDLFVSLKNTTNVDYAFVVYSCDFWDKQNYVIGRDVPVTFPAMPYQSIAYEGQTHFEINGMPARADCHFVSAEERNHDNERLYRTSDRRINLPVNDVSRWHPEWNAFTQKMKDVDVPRYKRHNLDGSEIPTAQKEAEAAAKFKAEHPLGHPHSIEEQCRLMEAEYPDKAAKNIACAALKEGKKLPGITNYETTKKAGDDLGL